MVRVVTPPTVEPVSLSDVQRFLRIDDDTDCDIVAMVAEAARNYAEESTGRAFVTQALELSLDDFPHGRGWVDLPRPPLQSVTSISYRDADGASQTLDVGADILVDVTTEPGRMEPVVAWPATDGGPSAVAIRYLAGYATPSAVPQYLQHAVLLLAAHWYEERQPVAVATIAREVPFAVSSLLGMGRVWWQ